MSANFEFNDMSRLQMNLNISSQQIAHAVMLRAHELSEQIKEAVDIYFKKDNFQAMVNELVAQQLRKGIEENIEWYFKYGTGKQILKDAIFKDLSNAK
jgi:hypothetical protein